MTQSIKPYYLYVKHLCVCYNCRVIELPTIEDTVAKGQMPSSPNESDKETQLPPPPILDVKEDKAKSFLYFIYINKICVLMFYLSD